MSNCISWLHLSDIHFNYKNFETNRMRERLICKLEEMCKKIEIKFIVITGDIVYQYGSYSQDIVDFINMILSVCNIGKDMLFIVPGNHDVKRNSSRKAMIKTIQDSPKYLEFDEVIEKDLIKGQNAFFSFYKKIKGVKYPSSDIHWAYQGDKMNIIHLNTAIVSGQEEEDGNLKINCDKLLSVLKKCESSSSINIAIGHHAIDCFSEYDKSKILSQFEDFNIDLYLCGHIHKSAYSISADGTRDIPTIVCGSNVVEGYGDANFVVESFSYESGSCEAKYFCWDNKNDQWVLDTRVGRRLVDGILEFELSRFKHKEKSIEYIDDDDFRRFISEFHDYFEGTSIKVSEIYMKDIEEKFENMKCNKTVRSQYDKLSIYFPVINQVMESESFMSSQSKLLVASVIIEEYNRAFDSYSTGGQIIEAIVQEAFNRYKNKLQYSETRLKMYIKILVYWLIFECDIFDDYKE